jgi:hypothetical protein
MYTSSTPSYAPSSACVTGAVTSGAGTPGRAYAAAFPD